MRSFSVLTLCVTIIVSNAVELPSFHIKSTGSMRSSPQWWAQLGDTVYYTPPTSFLGLSQNLSDYYYVVGSKSALTGSMNKHLVGSQGRFHIMHLPNGPSLLEIGQTSGSYSGDRRASHSAINQLKSKSVLSEGFPEYPLSPSYVHPLDEDGQLLEKATVAHITPENTMDFLTRLTEGFPTRSYSNASASDKVEHFLMQEFNAMGLHTCLHTFHSGSGTLVNVVAHIPGELPGSTIAGAHYDSRPFEGKAPGAEDNGSGVASLLAMARAFTRSKLEPKRPVFFVAFAGEEPGLIGSAHFASALKSNTLPAECTAATNKAASFMQDQRHNRVHRARSTADANHRAIIMDEIGWVTPKFAKHTVNLESYDGISDEVMNHLREASDMHNGDTIAVVHNAQPFGSDHMSFLDNSMAGVLTINGDDEAYPHYHQSSDTIENVNADLMAKITKMNLGAMIRMAMS